MPEAEHDHPCGDNDFPIREFPDLRRLRCVYPKGDGKAAPVDFGGIPDADSDEEDFGLQRSSCEDAALFLCENCRETAEAEPELREFLDDGR